LAQKAGAEIHTSVVVASIDHKDGKVMLCDWDKSTSWNEDIKEDTAASGFLMCCLICSCCFEFLCSCYILHNLVAFVKVWPELTEHSFHLLCMFSGFVSAIRLVYIYVVSFFLQLQSRWLEHCWSCKHIWEALLLLLEGMLFFCFWLNKIWDLQLRKTSYLITSSIKATPSVVELVPNNICPHSNDNCSFKHNLQSSLVYQSPSCWQICIT
jgi:hypothetical protein